MTKRSKKKKGQTVASQVKPADAKKSVSGQSNQLHWPTVLQALAIAAAVLWIYWPALRGDWVWDDDLYITQNTLMHDPAGFWKIWCVPGSQVDYYPLEQSLQWLQWQFLGNETLGYHLTNVVLHITSSLLVWRLLSKFGLRLAWLGGLIFAIHPMQVESVAWISEFKNTLSLPPFLLAMCAYIDYEEKKSSRDYWLALGLFSVAMLCKNSMALFPAVILLYAWWKRGRIGWLDLNLIVPYLLVSCALTLTTMWSGSQFLLNHSPTRETTQVPMEGFFSELALVGLAISFYLSKAFWPVGLVPVYPSWQVNSPTWIQFLPWLILGVGLGWLWSKRHVWGRHALLGLGFFLIGLIPVLGLLIARYTTLVWSLDHLVYIPLVGLIGLTVAGLRQIHEQLPAMVRPYGIAVGVLALSFLVLASHTYAGAYTDSEALWSYALQHGSQSSQVHKNMGEALVEKGKFSEAMEQYRLAMQTGLGLATVHNDMGEALLKEGEYPEAQQEFEQVFLTEPNHAEARYNLACTLEKMGRIEEATEQCRLALQKQPGYPDARHKMGDLLLQSGHPSEAIDEYEQAVKLNPGDFEAHNNLGGTLFKAGRYDEAIEHFEASLKSNPNNAVTHSNMGFALAKLGRFPEAIEQFETALKIKPDYASARINLDRIQEMLRNNPPSN